MRRALARLRLQMLSELGLEELVESRLQDRLERPIALEERLDLLVGEVNLEGGHREYVRLGCLDASKPNRKRWPCSLAAAFTQDYGLNRRAHWPARFPKVYPKVKTENGRYLR